MAGEEPKSGKKIVDVAGPETITPSSSSRPIIVQNRGTLTRDPMVASAPASAANLASTAPAVVNHQATTVAPLAATSVLEPPKLSSADEPAVEKAKTTPETSEPTAEEPKKDEPAEPAKNEDEDEATTDAKSEAAILAASKQTKQAEADHAKRQAELEDIIEKGTYAVPINAVGRKRSRNLALALILLAVVLVLVAGDALLDMGTIEVSGIPHTHFFK